MCVNCQTIVNYILWNCVWLDVWFKTNLTLKKTKLISQFFYKHTFSDACLIWQTNTLYSIWMRAPCLFFRKDCAIKTGFKFDLKILKYIRLRDVCKCAYKFQIQIYICIYTFSQNDLYIYGGNICYGLIYNSFCANKNC